MAAAVAAEVVEAPAAVAEAAAEEEEEVKVAVVARSARACAQNASSRGTRRTNARGWANHDPRSERCVEHAPFCILLLDVGLGMDPEDLRSEVRMKIVHLAQWLKRNTPTFRNKPYVQATAVR